MKTRLPHALFGVVATLVGMAAGHLVASLLNPGSSPVLAVGSTVIDNTPVAMKEWAIRNFGSNDKIILIGSVLIVVVLAAAFAGIIARTRLVLGISLLLGLVVLAGVAALLRPDADALDVVPAVVTAIAGVATLWWLERLATRAGMGAAPVADTTDSTGSDTGSDTDSDTDAVPAAGTTRRTVLVVTGVSVAVAAVMGGAGRLIGNLRARPEDVTLPAAADPLPALEAGLDSTVPGITPFRVPNADFYRVDTRLDVPVLSTTDWDLTIDGDVDQSVTFTFDDILQMEMIERDITLTCVSNSVGGPYVGGTRWLGVPLKTLLDKAGIDNTLADQMLATDFDGMTIGSPLPLVLDGRDAMLAIGMNGQPLPREHGFPARVVIPGLYGFISATKWVRKITLTTYAEVDSYWTNREWATDAPIRISSRIDTPKSLVSMPAGDTFIGGIAWAQQNGGVAKVQVQIDSGKWTDAMLGPSGGDDYWRQWYIPWTAESGQHLLSCRVIDGKGQTQDDTRREPFPSGSSGVQKIIVNVD